MPGERAWIPYLLIPIVILATGCPSREAEEQPPPGPTPSETGKREIDPAEGPGPPPAGVPGTDAGATEEAPPPGAEGGADAPEPDEEGLHPPRIDPGERKVDRAAMVRDQLTGPGRDITDGRTLEALGKVLRHRLVPEDLREAAYLDTPLPIGYGQTISQPYMVGLMTEKLGLEEGDKVLEIGTGSGYQAAVLAEICKEVYTIEIIEPLSKSAAQALSRLGYRNIRTKVGDGYFGWEEHGPYDGIIVTAAASHIPPPLLDQLADGGRLVIPLGSPVLWQTLTIVEKKGDDLETSYSTACRFVPMTGAMEK